MATFHCTPFNIDGIHSQMEMLLASLFDASYSMEKKGIIASNGSIEYTYIKEAVGSHMSFRVISLEAPQPQFSLRYKDKAFAICPRMHPLLDLSALQMNKEMPSQQYEIV